MKLLNKASHVILGMENMLVFVLPKQNGIFLDRDAASRQPGHEEKLQKPQVPLAPAPKDTVAAPVCFNSVC